MRVSHAVDEEALALQLDPALRRKTGAYFTPRPVVERVLEQLARWVPGDQPLAIIDPACGAGAFLVAAASRFRRARLFGLELSGSVAAQCRQRLPRATISTGDALRGGLEPLLEQVPLKAFELWVGNPPYNGTSSVLEDKDAYAKLQRLLPSDVELPRGTSLRDDFAFFLLLAAERLAKRSGALAFITSSTLLDAYLYSPLRRGLLSLLSLREVLELGAGVFAGTKVKTCVTVWTGRDSTASDPTYRRRDSLRVDELVLSAPQRFRPESPEWTIRPPPSDAVSLDAEWRRRGQLLPELIPISFPGIKTRFDELLVDDDAERLLNRVQAFLSIPIAELSSFAEAHAIPARCGEKLLRLKQSLPPDFTRAERAGVRRFFRYAGAKHRGVIPASARAYCYVDRRLIPRGDHRLRGEYDPHACAEKLVFNARELPLNAAVVDEAGCVHDHRHTRFAPLWVPRRLLELGLDAARRPGPLGELVPNLSARGLSWAEAIGGPWKAFQAIAGFINSAPVQERWAPAFGMSRDLPIPLE
jgi:hypothetical protein